jgi:gamma-glutamyltranspeptidase/glutathione hydrolase
MIEAKKLAYADLQKYIGEPRGQKLPVARLLSKDFAKGRAATIDPAHAHCEVNAGQLPSAGDTIYLAVVDREGNMVSLIQSNYESFGSGIVPEGSGFVLHDRGALFSLDPASPNVLAGRKRPLHTIIPAFLEKGAVRVGFGIMGGWNQSQAHAQFVADVVDYGLNLQQALEAPRFTKLSFAGCDVILEDRFSPKTRSELAAKGHQIDLHGPFTSVVGGGQAVARDFSSGVNYGASDPRKDGEAIPELVH